MKRWLFILVAFTMLVTLGTPASAITNGEPDGSGHPWVGLLVFDVDGAPAWRCTGTLLSPTVVLTAGHCTFGTDGARLWLDPEVADPVYPFGGGTSHEAAQIATHPEYDDAAFFLHDLGIVVLDEPVAGTTTVGTLPDVGILDTFATRRGQYDTRFTTVGYGLQSVKPTLMADRVRYRADLFLISVRGTAGIPKGASVVFSNNPGKGNNARGGTCFGDSGGPIFLDDTTTIVAVTSFGLNPNCKGVGGGYRIDTPDDQAFINGFLN